MRIAVAGGGPGGLYFAALARQLLPDADITVWERNAPDDTFGFGVVFSDETLGGIENADPGIYRQMEREFARWDDIDVHYRGQVITSGGHGFAAMGRRRLLELLQQRCAELGVTIHFRTPAPDLERPGRKLRPGGRSGRPQFRDPERRTASFRPEFDLRNCKYMWLGTDLVFDAFKFYVEQTPHGVMQVHGYPYDATGSTFIVEMNEAVWQAAGFGELAAAAADLPPGESDEASIARIRELLPDVVEGHTLLANNSRWLSFATLRCGAWHDGNVVLLGDAAHTAHFSIGSGTKLAMEDALALAACLHEHARDDGEGRGGAGRLRGGTAARRRVDAASGAGQPGVVREPGPVHRAGARAVRVQHHDPQPPRHPWQPAAARS